jgi:glycosyltransferase involved in cell wall biosynthesis
MIVRDSARTLGACLESIRPWVDELIVVDTGSKDTTAEIAKKYGAKYFTSLGVMIFPLHEMSHCPMPAASGSFGWTRMTRSNPENGRKLRNLVDSQHKSELIAYVAQVHCPHEQDGPDYTAVDHVKLFRNLPELRFEGRIHEQILPAVNRLGGTVAWTFIRYLSPAYADALSQPSFCPLILFFTKLLMLSPRLRDCPESARARGTVPILLYDVSQETLWRAKWGQSPALS